MKSMKQVKNEITILGELIIHYHFKLQDEQLLNVEPLLGVL